MPDVFNALQSWIQEQRLQEDLDNEAHTALLDDLESTLTQLDTQEFLTAIRRAGFGLVAEQAQQQKGDPMRSELARWQAVACPQCSAPAGEPCAETRSHGVHIERMWAADDARVAHNQRTTSAAEYVCSHCGGAVEKPWHAHVVWCHRGGRRQFGPEPEARGGHPMSLVDDLVAAIDEADRVTPKRLTREDIARLSIAFIADAVDAKMRDATGDPTYESSIALDLRIWAAFRAADEAQKEGPGV